MDLPTYAPASPIDVTDAEHSRALDLLRRVLASFEAEPAGLTYRRPKTFALLKQAASETLDSAPDAEWWRDYLTLTRTSAYLTEDGWEPIEGLDYRIDEEPGYVPIEVLDFRDGRPGLGSGLTLDVMERASEADAGRLVEAMARNGLSLLVSLDGDEHRCEWTRADGATRRVSLGAGRSLLEALTSCLLDSNLPQGCEGER